MEQITSTSVADPGEGAGGPGGGGGGPPPPPPPSPYLKVWILHCDLSIERRKKRKFVFPYSPTVTFDQFRSSLGPSRFKIKIEDSGCKMLAI